MDKKYIVHVVTNRPHGGIGAVLKNIESHRNHDLFHFVYIFAEDYKENGFDRFMQDYDCSVIVLPQLSFPLGIFKYLGHLYSYYKKNRNLIKVVHVHTPNIALPHLLMAKFLGIKIRIIHSHNTCYSENKLKGIINFFLIAPLKYLITNRCACGIEAARFLFKNKSNTSYILHNAIETQKFTFDENVRLQKRKELGVENSVVYGHVGNFLKQKNHEYLINVFVRIKEKNQNAKLILIGLGPLCEDIKRKVYQLHLENNVIFLGYRTDVRDLLMAMDIFLFPSLFEGFPVALVEAQCVGLPCLVSDTITKEVNITDLVTFLPIAENSKDFWSGQVVNVSISQRKSYARILKSKGYDLKQEIEKLDKYYLSLCKI